MLFENNEDGSLPARLEWARRIALGPRLPGPARAWTL